MLRLSRNNAAGISHKWQLVLFVLAHILVFTALYHTIYKVQYSSTGLYFDYASKVLNGSLPYRDFVLEYPPFSLSFFILPRLVASTWPIFSIYYQAEVVIFDLIGLSVIYSIARRLAEAPWKMLAVYTMGILAMGPIVGQQYDIFPAVMSILAVYYFWLGKHKVAWALIALGTMTKIYPAVIAPVFLIYSIRNRQYKRIGQGIITFAAVGLAIALPFLIISPTSLWNLYGYHAQRGIQLESTYSAFLLVADKVHLTSIGVEFDFGSWNITSALANTLARLSNYILAILLFISYWLVYNQVSKAKPQIMRIGAYSLIAVLIVLITSKVLSPQYIIWLVPFLTLSTGRWRYAIWMVFIIIGALTYYIFPWHYVQLIERNSGVIAALLSRDILLILMVILVGVSLFTKIQSTSLDRESGGTNTRYL